MSILKNVWGVVVDLVVGDDPKIALAVLLALAAAAGLLLSDVDTTVVTVGGAVLVAAAFGVSLLLDVRRSFGRRGD
jgi:hypothetical protein